MGPRFRGDDNKEENMPHLLIVEARFYTDLADALLDGATAALDAAGATFDVVTVPGALEIPAAIGLAAGPASTALSRSAP